jgi:molecular chaperone DnaK
MKIGIDFGTSFSLPAIYYLGTQKMLLPAGKYGIPSVFYYDSWDGVVIGEEAEDLGQGENAINLRREIKLDLNSSFTANGRTFTAKEIVGYILKYVKDIALNTASENLINETLDGVVLSVPANFSHNEKQIIKEAAEIPEQNGGPGLRVLGLIKEPVAAALSYFEEPLSDGTRILVYDLGGGTCDVAIVEANSSLVEKYDVKATETVRRGGKDWDLALQNFIKDELERLTGQHIAGNVSYEDKIKRAAISVKHRLTDSERARAKVEIDGRVYQVPITREKFEGLTRHLLDETINMTKRLLQGGYGNVDKIVCVGGSSNMPQIKAGLEKVFSNSEVQVYRPASAIAFGAAIYAQNCGIRPFVQDVAAFSYGTDFYLSGTEIKKFGNVIIKGQKLPVTEERGFATRVDNATCISFDVYESTVTDRDYPYDSSKKPVVKMTLELPPGYPEGTKLFLKLTLSQDGLLEATARDLDGHTVTVRKKLVF